MEGKSGGWQATATAQEVTLHMFFLWVYGILLGSGFSFGVMSFLWVYGFPLGLWFSFRSMYFLWVYMILILF